jgi:hypothetical protein
MRRRLLKISIEGVWLLSPESKATDPMVVQVVEIIWADNTRTAKSFLMNWGTFLLELACVRASAAPEPTLPDSQNPRYSSWLMAG